MGKPVIIRWYAIDQSCPELAPDLWTYVFGVVALVGLVLNLLVSVRIEKLKKAASFVGFLTSFDFVVCAFYLWMTTVTSFSYQYQINILAEFRVKTQLQTKIILALYESVALIVLLFIIVERFLWTCSARCRQTLKIFTVGKPKFYLMIVALLYASIAATITNIVGLDNSDVHFCDVALRPLEYEHPTLNFLQRYLFPGVIAAVICLTLLFSILTAMRLPKVGLGDQPVQQEEVNLDGETEQATKVTVPQIKSSIICMLVVFGLFLIRQIAYYIFIDPYTSSLYTKSRSAQISTVWWYDLLSLLISASRYILYYIICRHHMVIEYAANGNGHVVPLF